MNTYDPANGIVYRHMTRESDPYAIPVTRSSGRLPAGYSNSSPRTCLTARPVPASAESRPPSGRDRQDVGDGDRPAPC